MIRSFIVGVLILAGFPGDAQNAVLRLQGVDGEIKRLMEKYHTVGLSIAVVEDDKVIFSQGFGYRDLDKGV